MSIYDVNYTQASQKLLPPDKRFPKLMAFINCLLVPLQWVRNQWMGDYRTGSSAIAYVSGTYAKYQQVVYNTIVYESLINGNTDLPTVATSWQIVQQNFIGVAERILYSGITLVLTWALNKRFVTTFRQPPNVSDIFISNNTVPVPPFVVGINEQTSSSVYSTFSTEFIIDNYTFTGLFNFSINIPVAVYDAIDPIDANRIQIINAFVNKYIPAGITFNIVTY